MAKLRILGLVALAIITLASDARAQRRGGGAVSGGMRGAVVGGMVGGESGARTGAKIGVVTGGARNVAQRTENRNAMYAETQARTQYENTGAYQNAQHSNFSQAPPEVIVTSSVVEPAAPATPAVPAVSDGEAIIRTNGKPVVAITYPSDWKQKIGDRYVSAVSADEHAWSGIATLEGIKDKQAGITRIKQELEKYLQNIKYDEPAATKSSTQIVTGTGKAKNAGVDVVFAAGVFDAAPGQLAGIAFVADKDLDDYYKEAARDICQTIHTGEDLAQSK